MISIRLAPLYYTKVDAPFLFDLTPLEHQRKTLEEVERAMREKRTLAIINASATGSGKTLANYAYSLLHSPTPTIGIYPTNELIKDQERALRERGVYRLIRLDSVTLDEWKNRYRLMHMHKYCKLSQVIGQAKNLSFLPIPIYSIC